VARPRALPREISREGSFCIVREPHLLAVVLRLFGVKAALLKQPRNLRLTRVPSLAQMASSRKFADHSPRRG